MCNVPFHLLFFFCNALSFQILQLVFCQTSGQPFCERVFIKDKMIHIHVWSTDATHVRKKLGVENKRLRFDKIIAVRFSAVCLEWPRSITTCLGCEKATTPIWITGRYEPWSNTDRKQFLIKSKSCTLFYKRLFFVCFF